MNKKMSAVMNTVNPRIEAEIEAPPGFYQYNLP